MLLRGVSVRSYIRSYYHSYNRSYNHIALPFILPFIYWIYSLGAGRARAGWTRYQHSTESVPVLMKGLAVTSANEGLLAMGNPGLISGMISVWFRHKPRGWPGPDAWEPPPAAPLPRPSWLAGCGWLAVACARVKTVFPDSSKVPPRRYVFCRGDTHGFNKSVHFAWEWCILLTFKTASLAFASSLGDFIKSP